ncbi:MAG: Gfo/Idh/MocA family oxidoreductase [Gemmataceae bacterium]
MRRLTHFALVAAVALASSAVAQDAPPQLKAGIIGLDTSHVLAFAKVFHDPKSEAGKLGIRIVAAFPGGSPDVPASHTRVANYTKTMREQYQVEIVDSIDALLAKVDVVLLESVDGRPHLEQVKPVLKAGKPVFIDKPVAGTLADAVAIYRLAEAAKVPVFSSSGLRFTPGVAGLRDKVGGTALGCDAFSPCELEEHHPDLFWYGVHGVETLFTVMGPGCESVVRVHTKGTDVVVGTWAGGRIGTFRGMRDSKAGYGATAFGSKGMAASGTYTGYEPLVEQIGRFFRTGKAPVSAAETLEIFAFMEAADESKRRGGVPVRLEDVLAKARTAAEAK